MDSRKMPTIPYLFRRVAPGWARLFAFSLLLLAVRLPAGAQPDDRILFNGQELWLSGGNVAWINFARDIGPGNTNLARFEEIFQQLNERGGNAMRLWLHTTGAATPEWNGNEVVGPGAGAIEDLRAILDAAWRHEIGLMLCLWSFDMLRISNGPAITDRAFALLGDAGLTQTYIDNALVPMVDSLVGHPAIIAWEIFNEPEGMSVEHGWDFNRHVPMAAIQRFINQTAGAIHRTDPRAQITNGSWAFIASSDVGAGNFNYYTDERLIAAGGDSDGTLDFYTTHYYEWAGTARSPFHHDKDHWGLDKPLVIAEFFMGAGDDGDPEYVYGIHHSELYETLFNRGYAGALAWQWFNYPVSAEGVVNWPRMLAASEQMFELHPEAVDVRPALSIGAFTADPAAILRGESSELSWSVSGAETVTLNGEAVDTAGSRIVTPAETTTYRLEALGRTGERLARDVTVEVLDPDDVNRARERPASSSSIETCCGEPLPADLAFDGDPNTRWSSEWQAGLADEDPDDEWIQVDLGVAHDIHRIVLHWEAAFGSSYNLYVSNDEANWTTVHEERSGDGGTDEIQFAEPPAGRYVRMHGLERGTEWGYSLWEFEVYGHESVGTAVLDAGLPPAGYALAQNFPNPFRSGTVIAYSLEDAVETRLDVFDVTGRRVATLVDAVQSPGRHMVLFDSQDLASGLYVYRLHAGPFVQARQMVLMR